MDKFHGTVHLMDWICTPKGNVKALQGEVQILSDEEAVGFRARGSNSANWMAVISGPDSSWHLFGCQIRCVTEHTDTQEWPDTYVVK